MRYRWEICHRRGVRLPDFSPPAEQWRAWRTAEQPLLDKDPYAFEQRLALPIALTANCELLAAARDLPQAAELLAETGPTIRRDFALCIQGLQPWADTFALWCLVRSTAALQLLHPIAVALAASYAAASSGGAVCGLRFPFHERPLASASAHLAVGLLALGSDLPLAARLASTVTQSRSPDGAWGDGEGPPDPLTTLACVDLAARIDPAFDPGPTRRWFASRQQDGLWSALGPDAVWLTWQVLGWLQRSARPFAERFEWPFLPEANADRKTGLPFFAYYADLATLFATLPGLASARTEIAFFDLIGFRAFNNDQGQQRGDEVLRCFGGWLDELRGTRAIRDGGDEFLLLGAPTRSGLAAELRGLRGAWRERFVATFGDSVPMVKPRVLVGSVHGRDLLAAREKLGKEVTVLKHAPSDDDEGPLVDLGALD
jgi:GGDEF domain-containing protein